jgi:hypothetical protein
LVIALAAPLEVIPAAPLGILGFAHSRRRLFGWASNKLVCLHFDDRLDCGFAGLRLSSIHPALAWRVEVS